MLSQVFPAAVESPMVPAGRKKKERRVSFVPFTSSNAQDGKLTRSEGSSSEGILGITSNLEKGRGKSERMQVSSRKRKRREGEEDGGTNGVDLLRELKNESLVAGSSSRRSGILVLSESSDLSVDGGEGRAGDGGESDS